jgi:ABC-type transport system substrate-binding protein
LRANADYFLGKPRIARIVIELMSDENTRNIALRTGETDWSFEAAATSARQFAGSPAISTKLLAINGYYGLKLQVTRSPLDDVRVRRAIAAAIDRQAMVEKISANFALRANSDIGPAVWAYDPTLPQPRLDLALSRRLLAQAGFQAGKTGMLERDGKPLSLQLVYPAGRPTDEAYAITTQAMLGAVGIAVTLKSQQPNILFAPLAQHGTVFSGNFDLALLGFYNSADPNDRRSFACTARPPDGFNVSRWCDVEYDRVTADALRHVDRRIRKRDYRRASEILGAQLPEVFLFWYKDIHLLRPGVRIDDGAGNIALPYRWTKDG